MGGKIYITGDEDRPPVRLSIRQACLHGSMHATVGTMIAHYYRELSGEGQHVDVSLQESVIPIISGEMDWWFMQHNSKHREGATVHRGRVTEHEIWPAKDGYVNFRFMAGKFTAGIRPLAEWMDEEGMAGALKEIKDWEALDMAKITQEEMDSWEEAFGNFFKQHTISELHEGAIKRRFYFSPCYNADQVPTDTQLKARGFWTQVEHPELGTSITYPGAPFNLSLTPWRIHRRAPLIGEHNMEIYEQELGLSRDELVTLREADVI
jgi:crotonobetainyl-CoA:carnitine CoA-transferase CaiB-like acyl-CoA transferase